MRGSRRSGRSAYPAMLRMAVIFALTIGVSVVASPLAGAIVLGIGCGAVLAPQLVSRTHFATSDTDLEAADAKARFVRVVVQ